MTLPSLRASVLLVCYALLCSACAGPARLFPRPDYTLRLGREHPLVGRVWSRAANDFVPPATLERALEQTRYLLLGETHDNVDHHRLQAQLLEHFLAHQEEAAVAFEMLDEGQAVGLSAPAPRTAEELRTRVQWDQQGWPEFEQYRPIFEVAIRHGAAILPAQPKRERLVAAMHHQDATSEDPSLRLAPRLPESVRADMIEEIREAHCGHAPEAMVAPMVRAQSFRDAWMARTMVLASAPTALIAGRGHVREDRGVPTYLTRHGVRDSLTVAFVDVDDARTTPKDYGALPFDFVVFTPRVTDESACEQFKKQLERMKKKP